jgi:serine/threonine protein phosphatase PrpC
MIRFAGKTDPGHRAGANEDAIGWDTDRHLWFVADGMGGHAEGQMASGLVKETLLTSGASASVEKTVLLAHTTIGDRARLEPEYTGMASTVVCAEIHGRTCRIVWVGDSRAYLFREETLRQITRDHSLIERLREQQDLTPTQIRADPDRHRVTQALGLDSPKPSVATIRLQVGDRVLLCSDGLTEELDDAAILQILNANPSPETAVPALITGALEHGGHDNVSAIVVSYDGGGWLSLNGPSSHTVLIWLLLGTVALGGAAMWYFLGRH